MAIIYTEHLKDRLKERCFPEDYPRKICKDPEVTYFDSATESCVAIKTLSYGGKLRKIAIFYINEGLDVKIKTIHVEDEKEIRKRVENKRYRKL